MTDERADSRHVVKLTVARVLERRANADHIEVCFLQSARFYRLPVAHPDFERILGLLRDSEAAACPLEVGFASPAADIIQSVGPA